MDLGRSLADDYVRHRFVALFVVLLLAIAGHGFFGWLLAVENPLEWMLAAGLMGVVFSARRGRIRWLLGGLVAGCLGARLLQGLVEHPAPVFVSPLLAVIACLVAMGVALERALGAGRVDLERVAAALDAYLLAGIAFGMGYFVLETAAPGAFAPGSDLTPARAIYLSFVIQSTLGFGDIVPIGEQARGVVVAQAMGGQMYLAVLIARLVSLYTAAEERDRE